MEKEIMCGVRAGRISESTGHSMGYSPHCWGGGERESEKKKTFDDCVGRERESKEENFG
jgi:hypothetical protein